MLKLGITVAHPEPRPTLAPELEEQRVSGDQVEVIRAIGELAAKNDREPAENVHLRVEDIVVRSVSVHEHAHLLAHALHDAKKRLLIISP